MKYKCSLFCSLYKGEKFIQGYIEDVLAQSIFKDIEFIFLDCNSPENEKDFIIPLTKEYSNIKYHRLENDPGLYAAWNIAVKMCSSKIIGNWNVDDRKNNNGVELLLKKMIKYPEIDMIYGLTYVSKIANEKYDDNSFQEIYPYLPHSTENLLRNNSPHCMPLWRKDLHEKFGYFDENYRCVSDADMWLRLSVGGAIISWINHPVGLYYENPTGRSTDPMNLKENIEEVQKMRSKYK